jgi:hypothetical protein
MEVRFVNSLSGILRDRQNPIRIKQGIVAQKLDVGPLIFICSAHYFVPLTTPLRRLRALSFIGVPAANVDRLNAYTTQESHSTSTGDSFGNSHELKTEDVAKDKDRSVEVRSRETQSRLR